MAVFSTNQNRHLYVVKNYQSSTANVTTKGDIAVKTIGCGNEKELYFVYKGPDAATTLRSDRIQLKNLDYVKAIKPEDMRVPLRKIKVTLSAAALDNSAPLAGQDYVLRIEFRQFYGLGDQHTYIKDAAVHVTSGMTASAFYKAMVEALNLSFSRELGSTKTSNPYLTFKVSASTNAYAVTDSSYAAASADGLIIEEKEQPYTRGLEAKQRVYFEVIPTTVWNDGDEVVWAAQDSTTKKYYSEETSTSYIKNGYQLADLEYFCMGERGDQYRLAGWPNYIPTEYMITDPNTEFYVLELHFAFTDTGVSSYRSEKDITLIAEAKAKLDPIIAILETETGLEDADIWGESEEEEDDNP